MAIAETPGKMYALAGVLSLLSVVAVILRFYSRRFIKTAKIEMGDYMILPALAFTLGTGICMVIGAALGDLARHTMKDADGMPEFTHRTQVFQQTSFASWLTQTLTFGFTKLAVLLFYRRIFTNGRVVYVIQAMIAVVVIWTVGFFLSNLLQCIPFSVNWTGWGGAVDACINTNAMFLAQAWSDVITDVLILSLPLPCIWKLRMPTSQKIGVSSIFLLGTLVIAAGVAKLVAFERVIAETQTHNDDVTWILTPMFYWPMVESSLGVVGACLPTMRPLFRNFSLENFVPNIRSLAAIHTVRWRRSPSISENFNDASFKPSTARICQRCHAYIEKNSDIVDSRADVQDIPTTYRTERFDDLPDFPSLVDNGRSDRKGVSANNEF